MSAAPHCRFPDTIDAGAVVLRRRRVADLPELMDAIAASMSALGNFLDWASRGMPPSAEIEARITQREGDFDAGIGFEFVVRETTSGSLVGESAVDVRDGRTAEIGYWLRTDRTGRGYASTAAAALTTVAFHHLPGIERVEIRMDKGNVRSAAVARRLGFVLLGEERFDSEPFGGQTGEGFIWGITREEWATRDA